MSLDELLERVDAPLFAIEMGLAHSPDQFLRWLQGEQLVRSLIGLARRPEPRVQLVRHATGLATTRAPDGETNPHDVALAAVSYAVWQAQAQDELARSLLTAAAGLSGGWWAPAIAHLLGLHPRSTSSFSNTNYVVPTRVRPTFVVSNSRPVQLQHWVSIPVASGRKTRRIDARSTSHTRQGVSLYSLSRSDVSFGSVRTGSSADTDVRLAV